MDYAYQPDTQSYEHISQWYNLNFVYPHNDVPLHAPVPLPGYSPLLASVPNISNLRGHNPSPYISAPVPVPSPPNQHSLLTDGLSQFPQHQEMLNFYAKASEQTFPTPSELLSQLTGPPPPGPFPSTSGGAVDAIEPDKRIESQRKARHRAVAHSVGFELTDPDTISSHDKKRHYLECLEAYVVYLHEQLSLVGEPLPLERVSNYRGLSSDSIRTLLVHMENTVRKLHLKTVDEEQSFVKLRDSIMAQDAVATQGNFYHRPSDQGSYYSS